MNTSLTQEFLKQQLDYSPDTVLFTRKISKPKAMAGTVSNCHDAKGYIQIRVGAKMNKAHRLAWLYMTGDSPKFRIDHINGIKDDNRLSNLREATNTQNQQNQGLRKNNITGFKGVFRDGKRFRTQIRIDGKIVNLGAYATPVEAHQVYLLKTKELHGEFFRGDL